jgi:hypothetical protein
VEATVATAAMEAARLAKRRASRWRRQPRQTRQHRAAHPQRRQSLRDVERNMVVRVRCVVRSLTATGAGAGAGSTGTGTGTGTGAGTDWTGTGTGTGRAPGPGGGRSLRDRVTSLSVGATSPAAVPVRDDTSYMAHGRPGCVRQLVRAFLDPASVTRQRAAAGEWRMPITLFLIIERTYKDNRVT